MDPGQLVARADGHGRRGPAADPAAGHLGAAIGWAAAILANNLLPLTQLLLAYGLHPFGRATLAAMALAGTCFGLLPLAARLFLPDQPVDRPRRGRGGRGLYLIAVRRWRAALGLPALRIPAAAPAPSVIRRARRTASPGGIL